MEFAWNDALYDGFAAGWTVGGETAMDPLQAMERILLRLRRERPRTRPVILSVCPPAHQGEQGPATAVVTRCSTLFDRLSEGAPWITVPQLVMRLQTDKTAKHSKTQ